LSTKLLSREALYEAVDQISKEQTPPLEVQEFDQEDFEHPEAEESIWFLRGAKSDYRDAVHFWLKALQYVLEREVPHRAFGRESLYNENTLCEEISREEVNRVIIWGNSLKTKHDFHLKGQFQRAWLMSNSWNDISALAMTDREFVAFFWETTA
jgi:hypothetical protein